MKKQNLLLAYSPKMMLLLLFFALLLGCKKYDFKPPKAGEEPADVVYAWYRFAARMQLRASPQPVYILLHRNFGYIGVGLYESVRPGIKGAQSLSSYLHQMPPMPSTVADREYLWSASANAALASMFRQFLTGLSEANRASIDSMEAANNNRLRLLTSEAVLTRSQAFGRAVATAIYNWSTSDNFNLSSTGYTPPIFPGSWVLTPPAFAAPVGAYLKDSRPFMAYSLTALAPPLPFPYSEDPSSQFYKAAKDVYDVGKNLTEEQKAIANWWSDVGTPGIIIPPPYHTIGIITGVLESQHADLFKAAEVYAKTGIAMKDGPIITFRSKYHYNLIRPVTYIQRLIDPGWQSYLVNPPYPEYPSGLMGVYGPVIQVLIREVGDTSFTDDTYNWRGLPARQYSSLSQMAEEAALSRVYAGIHFRFTQYASLEPGRQIGNKIADINLKSSTKH